MIVDPTLMVNLLELGGTRQPAESFAGRTPSKLCQKAGTDQHSHLSDSDSGHSDETGEDEGVGEPG